jgi:hypothetical protein
VKLTPEELRLPTRYNRDERPYTTTLLRVAGEVLKHRGIVDDACATEGYEGLPFDRVRDANCDVGYYVRGGNGGGPVSIVRTVGVDRAAANIAAVVAMARMLDPEFAYEAP